MVDTGFPEKKLSARYWVPKLANYIYSCYSKFNVKSDDRFINLVDNHITTVVYKLLFFSFLSSGKKPKKSIPSDNTRLNKYCFVNIG